MAAQEFECGYFCDFSLTEQLTTTLTSLPLLGYAAYLERMKSRRRGLQVVRLLMAIYLVFRTIVVFAPNTLAGNALTATPAHVALFAGLFEWHKTVVEMSYQAVKLSSEPPKWIWWYTRIHQAVCLLAFPILYGLGGSSRGNPRCSTLQALTNAYLYIPSVSVGVSLIFCLFVVSKQVARVAREDQSRGASHAKRMARYRQALKKIRRISIFISFVILAMSYNLISSFADRGEPTVSCGGVAADTIGPLTGTIGAFLILWSTSIDRARDEAARQSPPNSGGSGGTKSQLSTGTYHSRRDSNTQETPSSTKRYHPMPSKTSTSSVSSTHAGALPQSVPTSIPETLAEESIVISEIRVSSLSGSPLRTDA